MWEKYYKIAERQFEAGKFKKIHLHMQKALDAARLSGDPERVAKSLSLLSKIYVEMNDPKACEALMQSAGAAEIAYGEKSAELADELQLLGMFCIDGRQDDAMAESALTRASRILEDLDQEGLLGVLERLVDFYIARSQFDLAERYFLRTLEIYKKEYGAADFVIKREAEVYATILEGQGKAAEAEALIAIAHDWREPGHRCHHESRDPEVEAVLSSLRENKDDLDASIMWLRDAAAKLLAIAAKREEELEASDPFRELKIQVLYDHCFEAKSSLAQLLRLQYERIEDVASLLEAAGILRELLADSKSESDRMHLALTLLDLANHDAAYYIELDQVLSECGKCAATLYTRALSIFRREGSSRASRAALREALDFNHYVVQELATNKNLSNAPDHFQFGSREEAMGYVLEAGHQWHITPGASEFLLEVMRLSMPSDLRYALDRIAPAST